MAASFVFPLDVDCFIAPWGKSRERSGPLHGCSKSFFSFLGKHKESVWFSLLRALASLRETTAVACSALG